MTYLKSGADISIDEAKRLGCTILKELVLDVRGRVVAVINGEKSQFCRPNMDTSHGLGLGLGSGSSPKPSKRREG
jgi:hypothetical protein